MERAFNSNSSKDVFIKKVLLDYCLKTVEKDSSVSDDVASMQVFPFIDKNGTSLGCLKDSECNWYYKTKSDINVKRADNIRILDEQMLDENCKKDAEKLSKRIKAVFGDKIEVYTASTVIDNLFGRMSKCKPLDKLWWSCLRDIYDLWDEKKIRNQFEIPTSEPNKNNYFLFNDKKYCTPEMKQLLVDNKIFTDVLSVSWRKKYFRSVDKKLNQLLEYCGISNKFTYFDYRIGSYTYNPNLQKLFEMIYNSTYYPIDSSSKARYDLARLSEYIMLKVFDESNIAFYRMFENKYCRNGMMVKNINSDYVSLSSSMFIIPMCYENEGIINIENNDFIELILDDKSYSEEFKKSVKSIIVTDDINEESFEYICIDNLYDENYTFEYKEILLYKWIWQFNNSPAFADCILERLDDCIFNSTDGLAVFIIDVLYNASNCLDIRLNIVISISESFEHSEIINNVFDKKYENVFIHYEEDDYNRLSAYCTDNIKRDIIKDINIEIDDNIDYNNQTFWKRIYVIDEPSIDENYVLINVFDDDSETIIVIPSTNELAIKRCIRKYISEQFNVEVDRMDEGLIDWKKCYNVLKSGINSFIHGTKTGDTVDYRIDRNVDFQDVFDFNEEKELWDEIRDTRKKIFSSNSRSDKPLIGPGKAYLQSTYKGYCQLCGLRTPAQAFYQFHIVEPREFSSSESFEDVEVNILCTCPSCWGALKHGFGQYDLTNIYNATKKYVEYFLENELELADIEGGAPLISELYGDSYRIEELIHPHNEEKYTIRNPIVIDVIVDGKERQMCFSWEHFIRIAIILNEDLIYGDKEIE